jgi:glycosyltransferase involved in cell wall biosynthesis
MFSSKYIEVLGSGSTIGVDRTNFGLVKNSLDEKSFITIGYLGRIANDKGIGDLLEVFFALKRNNPGIKLQIIGELDPADQISKPILNKLTEDSSIELLGPKSRYEIKNYVGAWSFQVFPSTREGLGNSILELAACGVPSVCWDIIGIKDAQPPHLKHLLIPLGRLDLLILEAEKLILNPITSTTKLAISNWVFDNFSQELVLNNFRIFIEKQLEFNHEK